MGGWSDGFMRWQPYVDGHGQQHSLAHLHPFRFVIELPKRPNHPARSVEVRVRFGLHVFTCAAHDAVEGALEYSDGREIRWFDPGRYQESSRLRGVIEGIEGRRCYVAARKNFVTIELDGPASEYRMFFGLRKAGEEGENAVELFVQSAYVGDPGFRPKDMALKPTGFRVLLSSALLGHQKGLRR